MNPRIYFYALIAAQVIIIALYCFFVELKDDEK